MYLTWRFPGPCPSGKGEPGQGCGRPHSRLPSEPDLFSIPPPPLVILNVFSPSILKKIDNLNILIWRSLDLIEKGQKQYKELLSVLYPHPSLGTFCHRDVFTSIFFLNHLGVGCVMLLCAFTFPGVFSKNKGILLCNHRTHRSTTQEI